MTQTVAQTAVTKHPSPASKTVAAGPVTVTAKSASVSGGKHVTVGEATMFVPRKIRTSGVKRKVDEIGTQQSVNKN